MKVRICQLVCPSRHCILAMAYTEGEGTHAECVDTAEMVFKAGMANRRCGICGSEQLTYDDRPTVFDDMKEALPALAALQAGNIASRIVLDAYGLTHDSRKEQG